MYQDFIKVIGIKEESRNDAYLFHVINVEGLEEILDSNFDFWDKFDLWENIDAQQWIFLRALSIYNGRKIDIRCDCCEYINFVPIVFEDIKNEKCYGKKSAYMINKVLNEIVLANKIRENDGTYFA